MDMTYRLLEGADAHYRRLGAVRVNTAANPLLRGGFLMAAGGDPHSCDGGAPGFVVLVGAWA